MLSIPLPAMNADQTDQGTKNLLNSGYRYALSLCANHADAQDYTHDAWIRAVRRYGSRVDKKLLLTIIRHLFIDQCRRESRRAEIALELVTLSSESVTDFRGECQDLEKSLTQLRSVEREALYLHAVEGYTASEIAGLTDSTRGSVLSLLARARKKLRSLMQQAPLPPVSQEFL